MQEPQQTTYKNEQPTYWTSVGIAGAIFGIVLFALSLVSIYATINSEPSGSLFSPIQLLGFFTCLIGAFGGMLAIWHYTSEYDIKVTLGRGALIGFLTGVCIALISILLSQLWQLIDPDMTQRMIDSTIANFEAMDMPEEQKQQLIDSTVANMRGQDNIGQQLLYSIPLYGILNLITGMIGAKVFGKKEI